MPQVQALLQKIGGYVAVESAVGIGTAIDLFFPVEDELSPLAADALPQFDRWANEGGAIGRQPVVTHTAASPEELRSADD